VMGFSSHQQQMHTGPSDRMHCVLGAPTSLASTAWSVRTSHAATTCAGETPKRASGGTWFGMVSQLEIGLSSCVLVATSPRRAKLGGVSRGSMRSADFPPPIPAAGAPPAGPWQELVWQFALQRLVGSATPLAVVFD
jgi:hypothetical protein